MSEPRGSHSGRTEIGRYEIRVTGHLDGRWAAWFDGLELVHEADGVTVIRGRVADQAALHGLLQRVRDVGLPLLSVTQVQGDAPHPDRAPAHPAGVPLPPRERNDER
jgi:hypothetical protein